MMRAFVLLYLAVVLPAWVSAQEGPFIVDPVNAGSASMWGGQLRLAFAASGEWLATSDQLAAISIFDMAGGRVAQTLKSAATVIAAHPSKDLLAVLNNGRVSLYDVNTGAPIWSVDTGLNCSAMAFKADGNRLYAGCLERYPRQSRLQTILVTLDVETGTAANTPVSSSCTNISRFTFGGEWYGCIGTLSAGQAMASIGALSAGQAMASIATGGIRGRSNVSKATNMLQYSVYETESGRKIADGKGFLIGLAASTRRALVATNELRLVDLDTGKATLLESDQNTSQIPAFATPAFISSDGQRAIYASYTSTSASIVDLSNGHTSKLTLNDLPARYLAGIAPGNDRIAFSRGDAVLLVSVSTGERRTIGNPAAQWLPTSVFEQMVAANADAAAVDRRTLKEQSEKFKKAKNPADYQKIAAEAQQQLQAKKQVANQTMATGVMTNLQSYGGMSVVPAAATFLDSGRLMAVRSADYWWDVWDVASGNRLPFRKPPANLDKYKNMSESAAILDADDLQEIEKSLTGQVSTTGPGSKAEMVGVPSAQEKSFERFKAANDVFQARKKQIARLETICSSENRRYSIQILRDDKSLRSAKLFSPDGNSIDLMTAGIDFSGLPVRPPSWALDLTTGQKLCALSDDGSRLILEGANSDGAKKQRGKIARTFAPKMEDIYGRDTAERLLLFDPRDGRRLCELEHEPGETTFSVVPAQLYFNPAKNLVLGSSASGSSYLNTVRNLNGKIYMWDASTCKRVFLSDSTGEILGFSSDGRRCFTATQRAEYSTANGIRVWDVTALLAANGNPVKPLFDLPDARADLPLIRRSPNGRVLMGPDSSNGLALWNANTGERLGTLRALQEGEWLITTPSGLFDGSPRAWGLVGWRESAQSIATQPGEIFFNEFYRPGLLAEILDGNKPQAPRTIAQVDRRQPVLTLASPSASTSERRISVNITVEEAANPSGGVRDLRLFRNGSLVKTWRGNLTLASGRASFEAVVPLIAGENRLVAYAFNRDNVRSSDAETIVRCDAARRSGTAYILAIGVNRYANSDFNLRFAVPDAQRLASMLAQSQREIGTYSRVVSVNLFDDQATRANILIALSRLAGKQSGPPPPGAAPELARFEATQPEDSVLVYFAGHGAAYGDRFYLIPHDLGYSGPRSRLRDSLDKLLSSGISDEDLERAFETVDTASLMLIIDACNSGKLLESDEERRGPLNSRGLAQLAYEKGMYVLTAAQAYQAAIESARVGHGYLTFALVEEALTSSVADVKPADGQLTAIEWFEYAQRRVPQLQVAALREAESGNRVLTFDGIVPTASAQRPAGLQTPRLYYRRDDSAPIPVISKR